MHRVGYKEGNLANPNNSYFDGTFCPLDQITEGSFCSKRRGLKTDNAVYKLTTEMLNDMNNELIVGSIFCIMDRSFDWVDLGIILSKLYFYGINGKDHALYQSHLDNMYFRTAMYNGSDNSNRVSGCVKVRHGVPQDSVLGLLLFLL